MAVAHALRLDFPLYALIAAIIVTDLSASRTRQLGLQRFIGTVIGATFGAALSGISQFTHGGLLLIALGVLAAILASHALGMNEAAKLAGYVAGILLLDHHDRPWRYALYRCIETSIGIGAAFAVSLVPKLLKVPDLSEETLKPGNIQK